MRIAVKELQLRVAGRTLLSELSFDWTGPGLRAVIGPSGVGKSTLLSCLKGWIRPARGTVEVEPPSDMWFVPQNSPLLDSRSVSDNLTVALLPLTQRVTLGRNLDQLLENYGLTAQKHSLARHLSGGERQRVALARAAICGSGIVLADEVTSGLDPQSVASIVTGLRELSRESLVVVATHDQRVWDAAEEILDLGIFAQ